MVARSKSGGLRGKHLVTLALIAGAVAVNFPLVKSYLPGLGEVASHSGGRSPEDGALALDLDREAAAGSAVQNPGAAPVGEGVLWHSPVTVTEVIPDPFVRQRKQEAPKTASEAEAALLLEKKLPEVSLVLIGSDTRRAVVGGRLVAEGDTTAVGRIVAIEADGVRIQLDVGRETKVPLRVRAARSEPTPNAARLPGGKAQPPAGMPHGDKIIPGGVK